MNHVQIQLKNKSYAYYLSILEYHSLTGIKSCNNVANSFFFIERGMHFGSLGIHVLHKRYITIEIFHYLLNQNATFDNAQSQMKIEKKICITVTKMEKEVTESD